MKVKKVILTIAAMALVAVISVVGTFAYLQSTTDVVKNTFTSAATIKITLDETDVDVYGVKDGETRKTENDYKLIPGHEYVKDPTIHVEKGSEPCYLFVEVKNTISAIEASGDTTIAKQMEAKGWKAVEGVTNVYCLCGTDGKPLAVDARNATADIDKVIFEKFVVSNTVNNTDLVDATTGKSLFENTPVEIYGYAIQTNGFEDKTAAQIWAASGFTTHATTNTGNGQ